MNNKNVTIGNLQIVSNDETLTVWDNSLGFPIIVTDWNLERVKHEPKTALDFIKQLEKLAKKSWNQSSDFPFDASEWNTEKIHLESSEAFDFMKLLVEAIAYSLQKNNSKGVR